MDLDGVEHFRANLSVENRTTGALPLTTGRVLLSSQGGWSWDLGDPLARDGTLFGIAPRLTAGSKTPLALNYTWSAPVTHLVLRLVAGDGSRALTATPLSRDGFTAPAAAPFEDDLTVALQEPLEQIPLSTGQGWLTVVGQLVNVSGAPLTLQGFAARFTDAGGALLKEFDLTSSFPVKNVSTVLVPFLYVFVPPAGATRVSIVAIAQLGTGAPRTLRHDAALASAAPRDVASPVHGTWKWGNGQGEAVLHTHFQFPEQRYAYDLTQLQGGKSFSGDPAVNASYFAFGQPIYAVEAGQVVEVLDDVPDNFGNTANPANDPKRNARIIVKHADGRLSFYVHVKEGSAKVTVGQQVSAGDQLAEVGNAGFSTEPHLHFEQVELDATGRVHALPSSISGLKTTAGAAVSGVPKGGLEYVVPFR